MKKILTVIAFSVMTAAAFPAVAQSPDSGQGGGMGPCYHHGPGAGYGPGPQSGQFSAEDRVNHRIERLTAHLNLSTEQQAQVKTIMQDEDAKLAAAWKETHDRIATVLNDQQRAQFEQWHAQHGVGGRGMGPKSGSNSDPSGSPGSGVGPQN